MIERDGNRYRKTTDWAFNNLTYLPAERSLWGANPLANTGAWTASDGRRWRTECGTAATGRNGCRSYAMVDVAVETPAGFRTVRRWVFNNIVILR